MSKPSARMNKKLRSGAAGEATHVTDRYSPTQEANEQTGRPDEQKNLRQVWDAGRSELGGEDFLGVLHESADHRSSHGRVDDVLPRGLGRSER